jgi:hypothetical protein
MAVDSNLCHFLGDNMVVSAWSWVRTDFWEPVLRGLVHGRGGFESFNFGVNGGVVHGRGFESLTFFGVNGGVEVHGRGFESLIWGGNCGECMVEGSNLGLLVVNCGVITIHKISKANQTPRKPSRPPGLFLY